MEAMRWQEAKRPASHRREGAVSRKGETSSRYLDLGQKVHGENLQAMDLRLAVRVAGQSREQSTQKRTKPLSLALCRAAQPRGSCHVTSLTLQFCGRVWLCGGAAGISAGSHRVFPRVASQVCTVILGIPGIAFRLVLRFRLGARVSGKRDANASVLPRLAGDSQLALPPGSV